MIYFSIPGFYEHYDLNKKLLELMQSHKDIFYNNIKINSIFGVFPFWILDGGRPHLINSHASKEDIIRILNTFNNDFNISLRLVCTNSLIKSENLKNRFVNLVLKICENDQNEIIINSKLMEDFIKDNYPQYHLISSTTKCLTDIELLKEELNNDKYKLVCLDYNLNHNFDFLNNLSLTEKNKCEFLVNAICPPNCQTRKLHYKLISEHSLTFGQYFNAPFCPIKTTTIQESFKHKNFISIDEIFNYYNKMNFSYFKIEGRTFTDIELITIYNHYFVKPEYYNLFFELINRK